MGAGDAAVFSYGIGLFRGFQRAMETDEVCGRPLDSFAFAITCCNVGKAAFGERNLRRKVDKHAGIVCSCHQLNRAKGSREELPCCGFWSKKKNIFAKAAGIFEGASKYISTRTEKGRDADGASESAEALTSVHVLPQELSTAKGATDFMKLTIYAKNMTVSPHVTAALRKRRSAWAAISCPIRKCRFG